MTLMEEVTALQDRLAEAQKARARAEGARESAEAALQKSLVELKQEFGVSTAEEGDELLDTLKHKLELLVADISARLDEIGI